MSAWAYGNGNPIALFTDTSSRHLAPHSPSWEECEQLRPVSRRCCAMVLLYSGAWRSNGQGSPHAHALLASKWPIRKSAPSQCSFFSPPHSTGANWHVTHSRNVLGIAPSLEVREKFVLSKKINVDLTIYLLWPLFKYSKMQNIGSQKSGPSLPFYRNDSVINLVFSALTQQRVQVLHSLHRCALFRWDFSKVWPLWQPKKVKLNNI